MWQSSYSWCSFTLLECYHWQRQIRHTKTLYILHFSELLIGSWQFYKTKLPSLSIRMWFPVLLSRKGATILRCGTVMDYQILLNQVHFEKFDPSYETQSRFFPLLEWRASMLESQAKALLLPSCQCVLENFCPQAKLHLVSLHCNWCLSRNCGLTYSAALNSVQKSVIHPQHSKI